MPGGPITSTPITSGSITTGANSVTIVSPLVSTGGATGILVTAYLSGTPSATQHVTAKLYQGSGTGGTQVNPSAGTDVTMTGTTNDVRSWSWVDTSAAAKDAVNAQYTVGFTASTGTNTILYAWIQVQVLAPVS